MLQSVRILFAGALLSASAAYLYAGGFYVVLGNPQANPEARALNAVVTAKAVGCGNPQHAVLKVSARGVVNGRHENLALKVTPLKEAGMFAVTRQWPAQGRWVLELVGTEDGRMTRTLARVTADGVDHKGAKTHAEESDIAAMLESAPVLEARK